MRSWCDKSVFPACALLAVACGEGSREDVQVEEQALALGRSVSLEAAADTCVRSYHPLSNYGDRDILGVADGIFGSLKASFVRFDPAEIQAAVGSGGLLSATLELSIKAVDRDWDEGDVALHRMTVPWEEDGATFLCSNDTDSDWGGPSDHDCADSDRWSLRASSRHSRPYDTTPTAVAPLWSDRTEPLRFDVTNDVQAALADDSTVHHGWFLQPEVDLFGVWATFHARESETPPRLVLHVDDDCMYMGPDDNCDGIDDDCDAQVDEGHVPSSTTCGDGVCAATGVAACVAGQIVDSCSPGEPTGSDMLCDGYDDDCDGSVDESYQGVRTRCGQGACAATGDMECSDGDVIDTCYPGDPIGPDDTCDGIDDDCDGEIDEACGPY